MTQMNGSNEQTGGLRDAIRFWEPRRIWYNAFLFVIVLLWLIFTWPHFRPALNLVALGKMIVLALMANLCYCAAYLAEFFIQPLLPITFWKRFRVGLWIFGMLLAMLVENYWIADEIYPDFQDSAILMIPQAPSIAGSNMNFPAPLAVVGFLGAAGGLLLAVGAVLVFWFARKPKFARIAGAAIGGGAVVYFGLLLGFSVGSHEVALARGQEKYFCEIDCHLAYSIVDVKTRTGDGLQDYVVTLRTRFDEKSISPHRPKDAPLTPSPRELRLVDATGHEYQPVSQTGASLATPLIPSQAYTTELEFRVPKEARDLRLLLNTTPAWPDHLVIGDENSWMHKKTYFAL